MASLLYKFLKYKNILINTVNKNTWQIGILYNIYIQLAKVIYINFWNNIVCRCVCNCGCMRVCVCSGWSVRVKVLQLFCLMPSPFWSQRSNPTSNVCACRHPWTQNTQSRFLSIPYPMVPLLQASNKIEFPSSGDRSQPYASFCPLH